jgi:SOS-response transcriptional repressor LexA
MGTNNNFSYRPVNNQGHWNVFNLGYMLPRMSTLASRINEALNDKGWSQERLAEVCKKIEPDSISQVAIHKIASGKSKTTRKGPVLAKALGVNIDWLLTGEGPKHSGSADRPMVQYSNDNIIHKYDTGINGVNSETKTRIGNEPTKQLEMESNVSPGPDIKGKVPLISWVQAGNASEVIDMLSPGDAFEWIPSTVQVRDHTFALRVTGDSMMNDFPPGMILIVEPDMDPEIGDYVIAKNGDEEATFKKLVKDAGVMYLKPLNPAYPMIPLEGYTIVGVVRDAVRKLR